MAGIRGLGDNKDHRLYAELAVNPKVVSEYKTNMLVFGATRSHEFTKAVAR